MVWISYDLCEVAPGRPTTPQCVWVDKIGVELESSFQSLGGRKSTSLTHSKSPQFTHRFPFTVSVLSLDLEYSRHSTRKGRTTDDRRFGVQEVPHSPHLGPLGVVWQYTKSVRVLVGCGLRLGVEVRVNRVTCSISYRVREFIPDSFITRRRGRIPSLSYCP